MDPDAVEDIDYRFLKNQTIEVGDPVKGETKPRRNAQNPVLISYYDPDVRTVYDLNKQAVEKYPQNDHLGLREVLPNGKRGRYVWQKYAETATIYNDIACGLKHFGLSKGDRVGIFSINRPEWVLTDSACHCFAYVPVALYATLGANAVEFVVNHAEISVILCDGKNLDKVVSLEGCPQLKHIICYDPFTEVEREKAKQRNVTLQTLKELIEVGKQHPASHEPPNPDDLCTIMYTSGSTGNPKGVLLTHSSEISLVAASKLTKLRLTTSEVHMSYLPLAHSFERVIVVSLTGVGGSIGFFSGSIPELFNDIQELRPTFLAGAPRVWQRLHDKMWTTVNNSGFISRTLFHWGVASKMVTQRGGGTSPIWDAVVFANTKAKLGGRVKFILSGSAPLDPKLAEFLKACFCCPIVQGYGLTENFAGATLADLNDPNVGHVGAPLACNEIKLVDVPEMNYFSTDTPCPRGEIAVRGPNVFKGYFKDPEKTAEDLKADGWFHTGDVGRWNPNGTLSVIDRKKNIFKLSQGEYVAAEYLESVFIRSPYVAQIFVYGDSLNSFLVAVVVPDFEVLKPFATQSGFPEAENEEQLCKNKRIEEIILKSMNDVGKEANLHGFEFPKIIYVEHSAFSEENNLLTPTFKLRRPNLKDHYQQRIASLYEEYKKSHPDA